MIVVGILYKEIRKIVGSNATGKTERQFQEYNTRKFRRL